MSDQGLRRLAAFVLAVSWLCVAIGLVLFVRSQGWTRPEPPYMGISGGLVWPLVGAVIVRRHPRHAVGWLATTGGLFAVGLLVGELGQAAAVSGVQHAAGGATGAVLAEDLLGFVAGVVTIICLPLLFPTGRLLGRRWWVVVGMAVAGALLSMSAMVSGWVLLFLPGGILVGLAVASAGASVVVRYRRGGPEERLQLRWFLAAITMALLLLGAGGLWDGAIDRISAAAPAPLVGGAIGMTILRYRLYDIDRIISRTVSYGLLTAMLVGVYAASVLGLGGLARSLSGGGGGPLVVAASTLTAAALFGPARWRIQAVVDRRFNRARYDAQRTVGSFARRLRHETDVDVLSRGLVDVTATTLRPTHASVWLAAPTSRPR